MRTLVVELTCSLIDEDDVDCGFAVTYTPSTPDVMYQRNGDPGWPGDPAELDVTKAWRMRTSAPLVEASFKDWDRVEDRLHDACADRLYDACADRLDET